MASMVASLSHTISTHTADITSLAFTRGQLATTSADKTVRLWSSDDDYWECACSPLLGHSYTIHYSCFSPLGSILATCSTDGKLILWDAKTGEVRTEFQHPSKNALRVCQFSPDSARIVSGSDDNTICMWEVATKQLVRSYSGLEEAVSALTYSPDGHFLVSGSPNGDLYVWDAAFGHGRYLALKVDSHDLGVTCCQFSPTFGTGYNSDVSVVNLLLATGGKDNLIRLWTFRSQVGSADVLLKCHASLPGHTDIVMACAFTPSGNLLASGSLDKSVRFWDPLKGVALFSIDNCHSRFVTCLAFSADGGSLATGSMDRSVKVWKLTNTSRIMAGLSGYEEPEAQKPNDVLELAHPMAGWSVDEVLRWLSDLSLHQYQDAFRQHAIDGTELLTLTHNDLQASLGVAALGHRNKILRFRDNKETHPVPPSLLPANLPSGPSPNVTHPESLASTKSSVPCRQWSVADVVQWLGALGLQQYQDSFKAQAIDGVELFSLTPALLETALGVHALGHRNKILRIRDPQPVSSNRVTNASPMKAKPNSNPGCSTKKSDSVDDHNEFLCPISMEIMRDPVIAADGYTYDRAAIKSWLDAGKDRSPMTNAVLPHKTLIPNRTLKMLIQKFLETGSV